MGPFALMFIVPVIFSGPDSLKGGFTGYDSIQSVSESLAEQVVNPEKSSIADVGNETIGGQPAVSLRSRFIRTFPLAQGYLNQHYAGSPLGSMQRLKWTTGERWSGCLLAEKDPGENSYADCVSANVVYRGSGLLSKLVAGDYLLEAGEGCGLWRSGTIVKGADIASPVLRSAGGIIPNTSAGEEGFYRGLAAACTSGRFSGFAFYSRRGRSASLDADGSISSLYTDGYFRTETEVSKKNRVTEQADGLSVEVSPTDRIILGCVWMKSLFSRPMRAGQDLIRDFSLVSFHARGIVPGGGWFGEIESVNGRAGGVAGSYFRPDPATLLIAVFRQYAPGLNSLHGHGFGESSSNESGWYVAITSGRSRRFKLSAWIDIYRQILSPAGGTPKRHKELFFGGEFHPLLRGDVILRCRLKRSDGSSMGLGEPERESSRKFRVLAGYRPSQFISVRMWYDYADVADGVHCVSRGSALTEELRYAPRPDIDISLRTAGYITDDFQSVIAQGEQDLDGLFSVPFLYGRGSRWYLLARYHPGSGFRLGAKYSVSTRNDLRHIGTGDEELPGNSESRLTLQADVTF